ncbi:MAG: cupin domain-containing protein [Dermabacter sp.]|nr:cupin domain-containing protein [Dermabacter sp.]
MTTHESPDFPADDPRSGHVTQGRAAGHERGEATFISEIAGVAHPRGDRGGAAALLTNESTKVVAFEFDTGGVLNEHAAHHPVIIQVIRGRIRFDVNGESIEMAPGQLIHLAPKLRHAVTALEPTTLTVTMLLPHTLS